MILFQVLSPDLSPGDINKTLSLSVSTNINEHLSLQSTNTFESDETQIIALDKSVSENICSSSYETNSRGGSSVRSTAVVKYCNSEAPALFQHLEMNFNLNTPPPNWMCPRTKQENHLSKLSAAANNDYNRYLFLKCFIIVVIMLI